MRCGKSRDSRGWNEYLIYYQMAGIPTAEYLKRKHHAKSLLENNRRPVFLPGFVPFYYAFSVYENRYSLVR